MRKLLTLITAFLLTFALQSYGQQGKKPLHPWDKVAPQNKQKTKTVNTGTLIIRTPSSTLYDGKLDEKRLGMLGMNKQTRDFTEVNKRLDLISKREENRIKTLTATLLKRRDGTQTELLRTEIDCWEKLIKSFSAAYVNTLDLFRCRSGVQDFEEYKKIQNLVLTSKHDVGVDLNFIRRACLEDDVLAFAGKHGINGTSSSPVDESELLSNANTAISQFDFQNLDIDTKIKISVGVPGDKTKEYKDTYEKLKQNVTEFKNNVNSWLEARKNVANSLPAGYSKFYDSDTYKVINSLTQRAKVFTLKD